MNNIIKIEAQNYSQETLGIERHFGIWLTHYLLILNYTLKKIKLKLIHSCINSNPKDIKKNKYKSKRTEN